MNNSSVNENPTLNAAKNVTLKTNKNLFGSNTPFGKEIRMQRIRAGLLTVPVSSLYKTLSPMELFDSIHGSQCEDRHLVPEQEVKFLLHDPPMTVPFDPIEVTLAATRSGVKLNLRVCGLSTEPPPRRRGDIPPAAVVSHTAKPVFQFESEYSQNSIKNLKNYRKAQYRLKQERCDKKQPQRYRADAIKSSRQWKAKQFDRLTGVVPQVGMDIRFTEQNMTAVKQMLDGLSINHKVDPVVIEAVAEMTDTFKEMFNLSNFTVAHATGVIGCAMDKMSGGIGGFGDILQQGLTGVKHIMWVVPLIGVAYYACTNFGKFSGTAAAAAVGAVLSALLPEGLWDAIKSYWPCGKDPEEPYEYHHSPEYTSADEDPFSCQAGFFEPATLGHLISISLTYLTLGKKDPMGVVKGLLKEMPSYSRNVDSWTKLSGFMLEVIENFVNFVRKKFGADNVSLLQTGVKAVDSWCARVMEVLNESHTGGDIMNPDSVQLLCALRDEGRDLTNMYRFSKDVSPMLHRYLGQLDDLCRVCSAAMHSFKGGRPQPIVMAITGQPGVGKTYLCNMLTTMILSSIVSKERAETLKYDFNSEVFMKGTTEFWNGYAGQKAVIMDDWGQSVPVAGGENDFIDLIRMANCWAYPLNFADVENKGKNFFKSSFLLLTTNIRNIDNCQKVIIEPDAITRRINHGYEMTVDHAFATPKGELDFQKITAYIEETQEFPYHAWLLRKYNFGVGNEGRVINPVPKTLQEIIAEVSSSIVRNQRMFEDNSDMVTRMLRKVYNPEPEPQTGKFTWVLEKSAQVAGDAVGITKAVAGAVADLTVKQVNEVVIPALCGYRDALAVTLSEMSVTHAVLIQWAVKIVTSPIVMFFMSAAAWELIKVFVGAAYKTISGWFQGVKAKTTSLLQSAFKKKEKKISESVMAQAIDALRAEDFNVAQMTDDGTYEIASKFTPEVLRRAYLRITGVDLQSNEPQNYKMKHTQIKGARVIESDVAIQADKYGADTSDLCAKSIYQIRIEATGGTQTLGQLLMVKGTIGIMPEHFIGMINEGLSAEDYTLTDHIVIVHPFDNALRVQYTVEAFLGFERSVAPDRDCVAVNFESIRAHRQLTNFFVYEADLKNLSNIRIRLDTVEGREQFVHRIRHMSAKRFDKLKYGGGEMSQVVSDSFEYVGYTKRGDCGGLATLQENPSNACRRILGLHVAGSESTGTGFCTVITREILDKMIERFDVPNEIFPQGESAVTMVDAPIKGSFLGLNMTERKHNMNPASGLVQTPLHNAWGVYEKTPARLAPFFNKETGERIVPMAKAIEGYASPILHFDKEVVRGAAYHAFAKAREHTLEHTRKIYTFEEAVAGVNGTNINGIPRATSPGYPHILDGKTSKKTFFGDKDEYSFDNDRAREIKVNVYRIVEDAKNNIRNEHIYTDFLKDELRAPAKVKTGASRLISASPMDYVIAFRMYFLSFTSAVQDTRIKNGVAVGINHYTEWDVLARHMKSKGRCTVAGDFAGFDTSEQPQILWAILDQINDWYDDGEVNARIRRVLWLEVVHSRHFGGLGGVAEYVYQWNKSLSSGHPATSIINSFYGLILFVLCWTDSFGPAAGSEFWTHVYACTYGDDNVLNIDEAYIKDFNQSTITASMAKYGMRYTNEKKAGVVADWRSLEEISFLKRSFRYEPTIRAYIGPLEMESLLYTAYWARSKKALVQNTQDNLEFSWTELSMHEPEVWDLYAPAMRKIYSQKMGLEPKHYFTRKSYLNVAFSLVPKWDK